MNEPHAGELRGRVTIFDWCEKPAADGRLKKVLEPVFHAWAKAEVVGSATYWGTAQIQETVTHRFWLRSVPRVSDALSLSGRTQLSYNGCLFRIRRVSDFRERHCWTIIEAEQLGVDDGRR